MLIYTNIHHPSRKALGLSPTEYILCDMVYHLSTNPEGKIKGWCNEKRDEMADEIGISTRGLQKMIDRLSEQGFIIKDEETKYLKTTPQWNRIYFSIRESNSVNQFTPHEQSSPQKGEQSSPHMNKVHPKTAENEPICHEQSSPPLYKDDNIFLEKNNVGENHTNTQKSSSPQKEKKENNPPDSARPPLTEEDQKIWDAFMLWCNENGIHRIFVQEKKFTNPLQDFEFIKLYRKFGCEVNANREILKMKVMGLDNKADFTTEYVSAFKTLNNWLNMHKDKFPNSLQPSDGTGTNFVKSKNLKEIPDRL